MDSWLYILLLAASFAANTGIANGAKCDDIMPCENGGHCMGFGPPVLDYYFCICIQGFSGRHCGVVDHPCMSSPCMNNATCDELNNEYTCNCEPFYSGVNCETDLRPCFSNPCMNESTCVDNLRSDGYNYTCVCQAGYTGQNCETDIDECASAPCMNKAPCRQQSLNEYSCTCAVFFSGVNCETEIRPCRSDPCMNGATCVDNSIDSYTCICQAGYTGQDCETDINECTSDPCMNNASCQDMINKYSCTCPPFYSGVNCETEIRPCKSHPCMNGSTCVDNSIDSYTCICQAGYTGQDCETDIDECQDIPCANNGTCINELGGFHCNCLFPWIGTNCTEEFDFCGTQPCLNDGTCVPFDIYGICSCTDNYRGVICEIYSGPATTTPSVTTMMPMPTTQATTSTLPITAIEDSFTTTEPTNTTIVVYTQHPARIELLVETDTPAISTDFTITTVPVNAISKIANQTDIGAITLFINTSVGANTTIVVSTMEPSDMFILVETVDAENTAALAFGTPNTTVPTMATSATTVAESTVVSGGPSVGSTQSPIVTRFMQALNTMGSAFVVAAATTASPANFSLVIFTRNPDQTAIVNFETVPGNATYDVQSVTLNPDALVLSFKTTEAVNVTWTMSLLEMANISLIVDTLDESNVIVLEEKSLSTQMPTVPMVQSFLRYLSTEGSTVVRASASTTSPANYTLIIYTRNPEQTANVSLIPSPNEAVFDVLARISSDYELTMTFRTSEAVNVSLLVILLESANISFQVDTADQSSVVVLAEDTGVSSTMQPVVVESFARYLSTQGSSVVRASTSTASPANYTLVIYTRNPEQTANVSLMTSPSGAAFDVMRLVSVSPDALTMTFRSSEAVNTTLLISLLKSANISLRVDTADQSSVVVLAEDTGVSSTMQPVVVESFARYLSTQGSSVVRASTSTASPANYTLVIYTRNPEQTANVSLMTSPSGAAFDVMRLVSVSPDALTMTFRSSEAVNTTLLISLLKSANISLRVDTADQSSVVVLAEDTRVSSTMQPSNGMTSQQTSVGATVSSEPSTSQPKMTSQTMGASDQMTSQQVSTSSQPFTTSSPPIVGVRSLSTQGPSVVKAFASTQSPANYTLVIYTRDPERTVNVSYMTDPDSVIYDTDMLVDDDPESLMVTFKTQQAVVTTVIVGLLESANVTFQVDTADPSSTVMLTLDGNMTSMQPPLSTSTVSAEPSTSQPSMTSQTMSASDQMTSQQVSMSSQPFTTSSPPIVGVRSLSTQGPSVVKAFASTQSPANYTLVIYTRDPERTVNVSYITDPDSVIYDTDMVVDDDPESLMVTFKTQQAVVTTVIVGLLESANVTFQVDTADPSSTVMLTLDGNMTSMQPPLSTSTVSAEPSTSQPSMTSQTMSASDQMTSQQVSMSSQPFTTSSPPIVGVRSLSTQGPSVVKAFASTQSPANYTLVIYTRDPERTVNVSYITDPDSVIYDTDMVVDDDPESLMVTFKTQQAVVTTVIVGLLESANVTFQVDTADPSSTVMLALDGDMTSMQPPSSTSTVSSEPSESSRPMMTSQTMGSSDRMTSQQVSMSSQPFTTSSPPIVGVRSLSTQGPSVVKAFASTQSPANYTLVIYTRDPERTVNVSYMTDPDSVIYDTDMLVDDDPESLMVTFKTQQAVVTTVIVGLLESANVTFQVDTADPSSTVMLALDGNMTSIKPPLSTSTVSAEPSTSQPSMTSQTMSASDQMTSQQVSMSSQPFTTSSPPIVGVRSLSTQGPSVVKAFASTQSPANYTLVIYTRDPERTVNVSYMTDPDSVIYDTDMVVDDDPESLMVTFKTQQAVVTTVIVGLLESANVTFQVDTADPSSTVMLALDGNMTSMQPPLSTSTVSAEPSTSQPSMTSQTMSASDQMTSQQVSMSSQPFTTSSPPIVGVRSLSTQGPSVVKAFASTQSPANYTLVIYTRDPERTVNVSYMTDPDSVIYDTDMVVDDDPESLMVTFKTQQAVVTTVIVGLLESANVTFQVDTADPSSTVMLALDGNMTSMQPPLSTSTVSAEPSTSQPSMTSQTMSASDQMTSQQVSMSSQPFTTSSPPIVGVRSLSTQGPSVVKAFASTQSPANYTLVIYTRDPERTVNVSYITDPDSVIYDTDMVVDDDPESLMVTFKTQQAVVTTVIVGLLESANVTFQVDTADPSSTVMLALDGDMTSMQPPSSTSTVSSEPSESSRPMMTSQTMGSSDRMTSQQVSMSSQPFTTSSPPIVGVRSLSTQGPSVVKAFASTQSPANYTLVIYTRDPERTVNVSYMTDPESVIYDTDMLVDDDPESLMVTFKTQQAVVTTVIVGLLESANVTFQVDTADPSSTVMLALDGNMTSMQPPLSTSTVSAEPSTSQPSMTSQTMSASDQMTSQQVSMSSQPFTTSSPPIVGVRSLSTQGPSVVKAFASTQSPANYTLVIYTRDPERTVNVSYMTDPDSVIYDTDMVVDDDPESLMVTFKTQQAVVTTVIVGLLESANVTFQVDTADPSSTVMLALDGDMTSMQPPSSTSTVSSEPSESSRPMMTSQTMGSSDRMTSQQVSMSSQPFTTSLPPIVGVRSLSTQGPSVVKAFASTQSPANYTLVIYTRDPERTVNVSYMTDPDSVIYDTDMVVDDDPESLMVTFKTQQAVVTTVIVGLLESANVTFQVDTADPSSTVMLALDGNMTSMQPPLSTSTVSAEPSTSQPSMTSQTMSASDQMTSQQVSMSSQPFTTSSPPIVGVRSLSTQGPSVVKAFASTQSPANYTLVIYTRDPERTVNVSYMTDPDSVIYDTDMLVDDDPESLMVTFKTQQAVVTTVIVGLLESANVTFQVDTADPSSTVMLALDGDMTSMQPPSSTSTVSSEPSESSRPMMTSQQTSMGATMSTEPGASSVSMMTSPSNIVATTIRSLSTEGPSVVKAFASTRYPANYTLVVNTRNPEAVNVTLVTDPAGVAYDTEGYMEDDPESLVATFTTSQAVDTTLIISLTESANITFEVETSDPLVVVELAEDADSESTMQPSLSMTMTTRMSQPGNTDGMTSQHMVSEGTDIVSTIKPMVSTSVSTEPSIQTLTETLYTSGNTVVRACVSAREAAVHTLLVSTTNPSLTVGVMLETDRPGVACFPHIMRSKDPETLMIILRPSEEVKVTFIITILESANITLTTETIDPSPFIEFIVGGTVSSTMQPTILVSTTVSETAPTTTTETIYPPVQITTKAQIVESFVRSLSTSGNSTVRASVSTVSPATYTLVIYTENPDQTADINLSTIPANVSYDISREISDNPAAFIMTFKTPDNVDTTIIMNLLESANVSIQVDTADQESVVVLTEDPGTPSTDGQSFTRSLSTQGSTQVEASVSTSYPANYTLIVYTDNPQQIANLSLQTIPDNAAYDVRVFTTEDNQTVTMLFKTSEAVNVTVLITLNDLANIILQVDTADPSSVVSLVEVVDTRTTILSPTQPPGSFLTLGTNRGGIVEAYAATNDTATLTLNLFTENPEDVDVSIMTQPSDISTDITRFNSSDGRSVSLIITVSEPANTTVRVTLMNAANISLLVDTEGYYISRLVEVTADVTTVPVVTDNVVDSTTEVVVTPTTPSTPGPSTAGPGDSSTTTRIPSEPPSPTQPAVTATPTPPGPSTAEPGDSSTITRKLSVPADVTVEASATLDGPANITFVIYTMNPDQVRAVRVQTNPSGVARDVMVSTYGNPERYVMHFTISAASIVNLFWPTIQAANISFTVELLGQGSSSNQVALFIFGGPPSLTLPTTSPTPPTTSPTPPTTSPTPPTTSPTPPTTSPTPPTTSPTPPTTSPTPPTTSPTPPTTSPTPPTTSPTPPTTSPTPPTTSPTPPTTSQTPAVFVNTTRSLLIMGPSQSSLLINARSAASVVVDVSGLAEFSGNFKGLDAVQVQQTTSTDKGSSLRFVIISPVNFTVMIAAQDDVEILATVISTQPDAALVTIVTESENPATLQPTGPLTVVRNLQTYLGNSRIKAMASTTRPANFTVEIFTFVPVETVDISIQTVPSELAVDIIVSSDQEKLTYMFKTLVAAETTVRMILADPGNISFTVTNVDDASMVTLINLSEIQVTNVTRTITTTGAATSLVSIETLEPSVIYLIINGSANVSLAAEPRGSVQTEAIQMPGSSVVKLTTTVPANVTLFVTTGQAVVIQTIVESLNPGSAVILLEDEIQPTNQPPATTIVLPMSSQTQRQGNPMIFGVPIVQSGETTVAWNFSVSDEPFILGFLLQYRKANSSGFPTTTPLIRPSARNYTLTDLEDDTLYVVQVVVVDRVALSFQKPVMTLSRDIMDPVPAVGRHSEIKLEVFHWVLISSAILVVVLLVIVVIGMLVCLRQKPKKAQDGVEDPAIDETTA